MRDSSSIRIFTRDEAERTLPLVRRIVRDLMQAYARWRSAVERYELVAAEAHPEFGEPPELRAAQAAVDACAVEIDGYLRELDQVGCLFKGFDQGLVDFYSLRDDRLVFLCWQYGEDTIGHWHEVDAGFAGRLPLDASLLTESPR
ncbi:MAG: DUF2203 domain-containing protein [Gemmatimonadota bacterium]